MKDIRHIIERLTSRTPEQFIEHLTKEPVIQSEKDVLQSFRNFGLTDPVINALLYYIFFMDQQADWNKLSKIAQYFSEKDIQTAAEALDTMIKLQQYEKQLDDE